MKRFFLFFLTLLSASNYAFSQSQTPDNQLKYIDILPPSPAVASVSNFSRPGVGMVSGTAQFNVPLTSIDQSGLTIPIGVNYSSNGVKVDEIASRVGTGFQFEGGGVITRSIRGTGPDEKTIHKLPPTWSTSTREMINYLQTLTSSHGTTNSYDSELDLFNFSFAGYSGQFILDDEGGNTNANTVRQINKSNLKIERDFSSSDYTFKITDSQGNIYFFGGDDFIETSKKSSTCGKSFESQYHPTAWFLKKILLFNEELITLTYQPISYTYDLGVNQSDNYQSQTELQPIPNVPSCGCPAMPRGINTCVNFISVNTLMLSTINARSINATFEYQERSDCGDKLLYKITLSTPSQDYKQIYKLDYDQVHTGGYPPQGLAVTNLVKYRPFLKKIRRMSADELKEIILYKFEYNSPEELPVRLSFSQDHWGYFNGKTNATLLTVSDFDQRQNFPYAVADREPSEVYAAKGLLNKITYPTGGYDVIQYEPNSNYETNPVYPSQTSSPSYTFSKAGGSPHEVLESTGTTLVIGFSQVITVNLNSTKTSQAAVSPDDFGAIKLVRSAATGGGTFFNYDSDTGSEEKVIKGTLPEGVYKVYVRAGGLYTRTDARITYTPGEIDYVSKNWIRAGTRVKSINSYSNTSSLSQKRRFKYGGVENPDQSVATVVEAPQYLRFQNFDLHCNAIVDDNLGGASLCTTRNCSTTNLFSSPLNNLFTAQGSVVSYPTVLEIIEDQLGEKNSGMIEHQFSVVNDRFGSMLSGIRPLGVSQINDSAPMNGKELVTTYYIRNESEANGTTVVSYQKMKRTKNEFKVLNDDPIVIDAVVANKLFNPCYIRSGSVVDPTEIDSYEVYRYSVILPWTVLESTTEEVFDERTDIPPFTSFTNYTYEDTWSKMATQISTLNSQGKNEIIQNFYSSMGSTQPVETQSLLNALAQKNNFTLVAKKNFMEDEYISGYGVEYEYNGNVISPKVVKEFGKNGTQVGHFTILARDATGNILDRETQTGIRESYVWDRWKNAPVAKVIGAGLQDIAYANFEFNYNNWSSPVNGVLANDPTSPMGSGCLILNGGTITKHGADPTKKYVVSYWAKPGANVSVESVQTTLASKEGVNGWILNQFIVANTNTIGIGGTGSIDDLRCYPLGAQMSTFVYDGGGKRLRIAEDNNGIITRYAYDEFDRLIEIRDHNNNIVKNFKYHYKGQ